MEEKEIGPRAYIVLLFLSIVWGSSFILIKKALIAYEPDELAAMRIFLSSLALIPVLYTHRKEVPWSKWRLFLAVGMTGTGIPAFMYFIAQTQINSTISGLLNSLTPIWTFIFGILIFEGLFSKRKLAGVAVGFLGAALLFVFRDTAGQNHNIWYGLFVVAGTICYGLSGNIVKYKLHSVNSMIITSTAMAMIGIPAWIYLLYRGTLGDIPSSGQEWYSFGALVVLTLFGTVISSIIFYRLVQQTSAVFASSVAYTMPLVATMWGWLDGETINVIVFVSLLLILWGVYLIRSDHQR